MLVEGKEDVVSVDAGGGVRLEAGLFVPDGANGIVLFAHGSGSSRMSPRNNFVAGVLHKHRLATLLMDLLTAEEDIDYQARFDIDLLTRRLEASTRWTAGYDLTKGLKTGYFGASTGAAAALKAAAAMGEKIGAVVSRGGRTDLAEDMIAGVRAPTLFIAGGNDDIIIKLNRHSYKLLNAEKELVIVPGATHLFEEPGALDEVAAHAASWFKKHIGGGEGEGEGG
jgi:pimeloyl-ACP methyl ester carboxylesterase